MLRVSTGSVSDRIMKAPWLQPLNCFLSPAKAGAGFKWGCDPRVTLAALASPWATLSRRYAAYPGLHSVAATRRVAADLTSGDLDTRRRNPLAIEAPSRCTVGIRFRIRRYPD